jgi:hypothetical protein
MGKRRLGKLDPELREIIERAETPFPEEITVKVLDDKSWSELLGGY